MKNKILALSFLISSTTAFADLTSAAIAGDFIAGFDFSEIGSVSNDVNGFQSSSDGLGSDVATIYTNGSFGSSSINQVSDGSAQVRFATYGRAARTATYRFDKGFDTTTDATPGGAATGQNSLLFKNLASTTSFVIGLDQGVDNRKDLVIEFDYMIVNFNDYDLFDIHYSADGSSYTELVPSSAANRFGDGPEYTLFPPSADNTWATTSSGGRDFNDLDGQDNGVVTIEKEDFTTIKYIRFDLLATDASEEFYLDNISITGSQAVPEASTYAFIAGALALGFAVIRRRK